MRSHSECSDGESGGVDVVLIMLQSSVETMEVHSVVDAGL